jgi:hypothetical protein
VPPVSSLGFWNPIRLAEAIFWTGISRGPLCRNSGRQWSEWSELNRRPPAPRAGALPGCATPCLFATFRDIGCREKAGGTSRRCPCKTSFEARPLSKRLPSLTRLAVPCYRANPASLWRSNVQGRRAGRLRGRSHGLPPNGETRLRRLLYWRNVDESNVRDRRPRPGVRAPLPTIQQYAPYWRRVEGSNSTAYAVPSVQSWLPSPRRHSPFGGAGAS